MPEVKVVNHNLWEQAVSNPLPAVLAALYHFVPRVPVSPELRLYAAILGGRGAADRRRMLTEIFTLLNRPSGEWEDYQDSCARWVSGLLGESITRDTEILREPLHQALGKIPEHLQEVLRLRFGLNGGRPQTLEQVGRRLGVTREWTRQKEAKALRLLRHPIRCSALRQLSPGEWLRSRVFTALEASAVPTAFFILWAEDRKHLDWLERAQRLDLDKTARQIEALHRRLEYLQSLVRKVYRIPITEIGLSARAVNALRHHPGITDTPMLGEVVVLTDRELLNIRGFGPKTLQEVRQGIWETPREQHGEGCLQDAGENESNQALHK
jgi:hypothetical protein